jgi:glycosyltransferase involved in cell wall biosynthesis
MPYISVVMPTMRPGGLDIVCSSLENQTFKDFELVIVDNLYHYRKDLVAEKSKEYSFPIKHIPPMVDKFPIHSPSSTINTGIINTSGEVIIMTIDYKYFMPWCLQKHADFHMTHPDNHGYSPPSKYVVPEKFKSGLPAYQRNYDQYVQALRDNKLKDFMWSINDEEFTKNGPDPSGWKELDKLYGYDTRTAIPPGVEVSPLLFFIQGESIKTKMILAANGLNEEMDAAPNYQDIELSHRLRNLFGFKFYGDNTNVSYRITGGHRVIEKLQFTQSVCNKVEGIFKRAENGFTGPINDWSLLEEYKKIRGIV